MSDNHDLEPALDLIVVGDLVLPDRVLRSGAVGVRDGRIVGLYESGALPRSPEVIWALGQYVLPGAVDAHVHCFSAPQEGFVYATRAAAAGGVTTIIEMPYDAGAPIISVERFDIKRQRLEQEAIVDVAMLATIKKIGGLDEIPGLAAAGACGFKVSLYETDPERFARIPDGELVDAFERMRATGLPVGLHAENDEIVKRATDQQRLAANPGPEAHTDSRPRVAEAEAVLRALEFAYWTGVQLHIYHATFPRVFELVSCYKEQGVRASAETCIHYLLLTEDDLRQHGARLKVNPPLRSASERDQLWQLLRDKAVDLVTSDHAPWLPVQKSQPCIFDNASGSPGVETLLPLLFSEGVMAGRISLHDLVRVVAETPARIWGLAQKGRIEVGADADLIVIDPKSSWRVDENRLHSSAGWSPFDGWKMQGRISRTILRGETIYDGDKILAEPGTGKFLRPMKAQ